MFAFFVETAISACADDDSSVFNLRCTLSVLWLSSFS